MSKDVLFVTIEVMGFFNALGKIIKGEPVFSAQNEVNTQPVDGILEVGKKQQDVTRTDSGHKVEPSVRVARVKTSRNGSKMVSYAWVQNNSLFAVEVTKFYVGGQSINLNCLLGANQGRQVKIYDGTVKDNNKDSDAYLDCKIAQNGDYFRQNFYVEYHRESDGGYLVEELHPVEVKDI